MRVALYAVYLAALVGLCVFAAGRPFVDGRKALFVEGNLVEDLQAVHLGAAVAGFACAAAGAFRAGGADRWMVAVFLLGTSFAFHREFDFV